MHKTKRLPSCQHGAILHPEACERANQRKVELLSTGALVKIPVPRTPVIRASFVRRGPGQGGRLRGPSQVTGGGAEGAAAHATRGNKRGTMWMDRGRSGGTICLTRGLLSSLRLGAFESLREMKHTFLDVFSFVLLLIN